MRGREKLADVLPGKGILRLRQMSDGHAIVPAKRLEGSQVEDGLRDQPLEAMLPAVGLSLTEGAARLLDPRELRAGDPLIEHEGGPEVVALPRFLH